jgi:hypothetical protein
LRVEDAGYRSIEVDEMQVNEPLRVEDAGDSTVEVC